MSAVIQYGTKQLKVSQGDIIKIEKVDGNVGDSVKIENVLMAGDGKDIQVGEPSLQELLFQEL